MSEIITYYNTIYFNHQPSGKTLPSNNPEYLNVKIPHQNFWKIQSLPNQNHTSFLNNIQFDTRQKHRHKKRNFSLKELNQLYSLFKKNTYPSSKEFEKMMAETKIPKKRIMNFFQNNRIREKKKSSRVTTQEELNNLQSLFIKNP